MNNLFKLCEIEQSMKFVGQAAARGTCNAINFFLINTASNMIRQRRAGIPEATEQDPTPINHIDNYDTAQKDQDDQDQTDDTRAEQGFTVPDDPVVVAGYVKVIFAELNEELLKHAGKVEYQSTPGQFYPNPFEIPTTLAKEIDRQMRAARMPHEAILKNEAEILGRPIEEIIAAAGRKIAQRVGFIKENAKEIIELASNWHLEGDEAGMDHESAYERLHPMQQLRLLAGADSGLWFAIGNQIQNPRRLDLREVRANIDLIEGRRTELLAEVSRLMRIDSFGRQVREAEDRGQVYPRFNPAPEKMKAKTA